MALIPTEMIPISSKYNVIVPGDHPITLSNNSRYHSHTSNTCLKRVQIARFTHYYIATWRNHSAHAASRTASSRRAADVDSNFSTKLERRNKTSNPPNRLPGSRTRAQNLSNNYQYNLYWPLAPTLCFCVCFCGSGMQA